MNAITHDQIRETLAPYGFSPDEGQCRSIRTYISLLLHWNARVSLTTVVDPAKILRFHFGESLYASVCVPILNGRLADVGSGPGFPGLPLKIALPDLSVTLIESNIKKAAFLREVIQALKLDHSEVVRERMENAPSNNREFDFVVARALGNYPETLKWAHERLAGSAKVVLWLTSEDASLVSADARWNWAKPTHIPGTERRVILAGTPIR